jgi:hypothetical protein
LSQWRRPLLHAKGDATAVIIAASNARRTPLPVPVIAAAANARRTAGPVP